MIPASTSLGLSRDAALDEDATLKRGHVDDLLSQLTRVRLGARPVPKEKMLDTLATSDAVQLRQRRIRHGECFQEARALLRHKLLQPAMARISRVEIFLGIHRKLMNSSNLTSAGASARYVPRKLRVPIPIKLHQSWWIIRAIIVRNPDIITSCINMGRRFEARPRRDGGDIRVVPH